MANQSRPDFCFATFKCARYMSNPAQQHEDALHTLFEYLQGAADFGIKYRRGKTDIVGFSDSDFGGCVDTRRSTTGWIFMFGGAPVSWCSQRQKTVSLSTAEAEYIAASECAKEAIWIRGFVNDLPIPEIHVERLPIYMDNDTARKLTRNPEMHNRTKYIEIRHHFVRERVTETMELETLRVDTKDNLADILTKPLARESLERFRDMMVLVRVGDEGLCVEGQEQRPS
jgi:hypothetical protein